MKKKLLFITITLMFIVLAYYLYNLSIKLEYTNIKSIQVGDKVPTIKDYTNNDKVSKITWKGLKIEKGKAYNYGTYEGIFTYRKKEYTIKLKVDDRKSPKLSNIKDIETTINQEADLKKDIKVEDNSHDDIKINIVGDYNFKQKCFNKLVYKTMNGHTSNGFYYIGSKNN